jgi:putative sterol carrier protein
LEKLKPELVSPMAVYLVSEQCPVSGNIYNVGMGRVNRAALLTGAGAVVGDRRQLPTPEQLLAQWPKIFSLKEAKEYQSLSEQLGDLLNAFLQPAADAVESGQRFTLVSEVFDAMPEALVADAAAGVDVIFQYSISGDGGGDWFCSIRNGKCRVEAGHHEGPSCTLKMRDSDFLDLMNGRLPAMQAYTSGKLRIEGDIIKSQLIEKCFRFKVNPCPS